MDRDERDIHKIMEAAEQKQNPFDLNSVPEELIESGQVVSEKVARSSQTSSKMVQSRMPSLLNNI